MTISILKWDINYFKITIISLIVNFKWNYVICQEKVQIQKLRLQYQKNLLYWIEVMQDISKLPLLQ